MAITNHERVGKMMDLLSAGLKPFVERELKNTNPPNWFAETKRSLADAQLQLMGTPEAPHWDASAILVTMWNQWNEVFRKTLGQAERTLVSELRETRNRWSSAVRRRFAGLSDADSGILAGRRFSQGHARVPRSPKSLPLKN